MPQAGAAQLHLELPAEPVAAVPRAPLRQVRSPAAQRQSLTLGEAARIIREAVKDKSYRKTPLGQLVARYLRWLLNE